MTDSERIDWLEMIAQELNVQIRVDQQGVFEVQLGHVMVGGISLLDALDLAIGPQPQFIADHDEEPHR